MASRRHMTALPTPLSSRRADRESQQRVPGHPPALGSGLPPRARKRLTAAQRKAQILEVAVAQFGRRGFHGTSTKALAVAAGISEATMFQYFPTKQAIYLAAFNARTLEGTKELVLRLQALADQEDDRGVMRALVAAILEGYERDRDIHRMLLYAWLDQERVENRRMWQRIAHSPLFEFTRRYVANRQGAGVFRPGDSALIAWAMVALPVHYAVQSRLYEVGLPFSDIAVVETLSNLILDGAKVAH